MTDMDEGGARIRGRRDDPECRAFGRRLAAARRRLGWSQPTLCEMAAVPLSGLWWYESGLRWPLAGTLARLARTLGVSCDWLLTGEAGPPTWPALEDSPAASAG